MDNIVGIRFLEAGAIAYCSPGSVSLGMGDYVVVRTDRGERLGWVVLTPEQVLSAAVEGPLRVVDRLASEEDVSAWRAQKQRAQEDIGRAQAIAARTDPRVRVASLSYDLAGGLGELTFTAHEQERAEWLRRDASRALGADLEVWQVGDRDRAKSLGGIGQCGRALCCSTWQVEFPAISIKMAKDQGLAPNPSKISGVCGRLLCCLSFEVEAYREIVGTLPKVGKRVSTPVGRARVLSINAMTEVVRMRIDETGEVIEIPAAQLRSQYGTAVRPADLEDAVETALHAQDQQRRDAFLGVLTPIDMPAPARARPSMPPGPRGDGPGREGRGPSTSRGPQPERTQRPARDGAPRRDGGGRDGGGRDGGGRDDGGRDEGGRAEGGRAEGAPRREQPRRDDGRPGIARRRPSTAGQESAPRTGAPRPDGGAPRAVGPTGAPGAEQPPRVDGDAEADGARRIRRRGRRGGRRGGGAGTGNPE